MYIVIYICALLVGSYIVSRSRTEKKKPVRRAFVFSWGNACKPIGIIHSTHHISVSLEVYDMQGWTAYPHIIILFLLLRSEEERS